MKTRHYSIVLFLLLVTVAVVVATAAQDVSLGKKVYDSKCAICHGSDGKADTKAGKMTKTPDMTQTPWKYGTSQEEVEKATREGVGTMGGYEKTLTPEEITAVAEYTRKLCGVDKK